MPFDYNEQIIEYCPKLCINCGETYNWYRPLTCLCHDKPRRLANKRREKWDHRFLQLAKFVSEWSNDPSTKTGAVIVDKDNRVVSVGYNGFAMGVKDDERLQNRDIKYEMIVHCEVNAAISAKRDLTGYTLYTYPFMSCSRCAAQMIQFGIKRHVAPADIPERWGKSCKLSQEQFKEAGVEVALYPNLA